MTDLGGPYATRAVLKSRMRIPDSDTTSDDSLDDALLSASDAINRWTGRQFGQVTVASLRTYFAGVGGIDVDDFWTTDDLVIGGVSWTSDSQYVLEPANGIRDGVTGWAYDRLVYPYAGHPVSWLGQGTASVQVTAKWGWAAVPAGIRQACLLLAADDVKSADAPFGVAGFGDYAIRVRANPKVAEKLAPYVRTPVQVAS